MSETHIHCPCCATVCDAPDWDEVLFGSDGETECPVCGWEFRVSPDGEIDDDGGLDLDGPFTIDAEGELTEEWDDAEPEFVVAVWDVIEVDDEEEYRKDWSW